MKKSTLRGGGGNFWFPPPFVPSPDAQFTKRQQVILTILHAMITADGVDEHGLSDTGRRNLIFEACKLTDELLNSKFF
jgi:hypothetical protein